MVTEKMNNSADYIENRTDNKNESKIIKDTEVVTVTKKDIAKEQITKAINESMTENVTKISQNNSTDTNVPKHDLPKNIDSNDMSSNIKNKSITENETIIFKNNVLDKGVQEYDLPTNLEINDMHNNFDTETMTGNKTKEIQNKQTDANDQKYNKPSNIEGDMHANVRNEDIIDNTTIIQKNCVDKDDQKYVSPKYVQKRDIGKPEKVSNDRMPQVNKKYKSQGNNEKYDKEKRTNDDTIKRNHNYDKQKHKHYYKINDNEPYNYQNYEMNYKKIIDKDELKRDKHTSNFNDDVSQHIKPQIQTRINNDLVKKSLDEFKMVRRKTHYTIPQVDFKNDDKIQDAVRYQDIAYYTHVYEDISRINGARNHVDSDYHIEDDQIAVSYQQYPNYGEKNDQSYEELNMPHIKEMNTLLTRQKDIVRKLAKMQMANKNLPVTVPPDAAAEFNAILKDIEARNNQSKRWKNYTQFSFDTTTKLISTKSTTTLKPTTILTLFDETEIRRALKNDPLVKRILKMANLKREKYLDNVRKYLIRKNYVHDKEYAKKLAEGPSNRVDDETYVFNKDT